MASDRPLPPEVLARMNAATPAREKQEPHELPQWAKTALVMRAVEDLTFEEAAKRFNRTAKTLGAYGQSPAAEKWLGSLSAFLADPVAMARAILGANALSITLDRFMMYEAAKETNIELADKIARDLQDRMGIVAKKVEAGAISVKINLGGTSMEIPVIEAEYEVVEPRALPRGDEG